MGLIPFNSRPGKEIESVDFPPQLSGVDFSNCRIDWARGKKVQFKDCDFSSSLIKNCYFHRATFVRCNFTGCSIVDSNFRGASFKGCDFKYASVRATPIDARQLLKNLPYWENSQREFLRCLRKNAESIGDVEDVRLFLRAEMDASAEHWRSAFRQVTPYYQEHYPGVGGKASALVRLLGVKVGKWFWGYGESPLRLLSSLVIWVACCSLWVAHSGEYAFSDAIKLVAAIFFGVHDDAANLVEFWSALTITLSRYLFIGLFAAVFVRRFSRR